MNSTTMTEAERHQALEAMVRQSPWLMNALAQVRHVAPPDWCIGAGAIRNLVWDSLHGKPSPSQLPDVDVAYFDAADISPQRDLALQAALRALDPSVPWEVTNQAGVHLWFEAQFGHAVEPLHSLEEGIASWPEFATAVGVSLGQDDALKIIAPHGLEDLFAMVVRRNPARVSVETYRQRVAQKRFEERWPNVRVMPAS